jgi:hypothetical protein
MPIARGNQGQARHCVVVVLRFTNLHPANLVKPMGKRCGELFRHMLDNQRARGIRGQIPE